MNIRAVRHEIVEMKRRGKSYYCIAKELGVNRSGIWKVAHGIRPGPHVCAALGIDPPSGMKYTRTRRERLDEIAQGWGYASWCSYETSVLVQERIEK
jgi:hypothetical protein